VHDLRDLSGRTRRLLVSIAVGVGGVLLIVFAIDRLIDQQPNGIDVWMMFAGVIGLTVANFHLLERIAHRRTLPRAVIRKRGRAPRATT
jgi:divalent metal cation (Fe/Co/Zn/Cd) transporter